MAEGAVVGLREAGATEGKVGDLVAGEAVIVAVGASSVGLTTVGRCVVGCKLTGLCIVDVGDCVTPSDVGGSVSRLEGGHVCANRGCKEHSVLLGLPVG